MAILCALGALYWQSGGFNDHFVTNSIGALLVFVLVRTRRGRRLLFIGWCGLLAIPLLSMKLDGVDWPAVKGLLVALWLGVLWFVELERVIDWIDGWRGLQRGRSNEIHRCTTRRRTRGIVAWQRDR